MNRRQFSKAVSWLATLAMSRVPGDPPKVGRVRATQQVDHLGDPIPPQALTRVGTTRFWDRPSLGRLESMASSPDGRLIATANLHDPVTIWDAATGEVVRRLGREPAKHPGYSYTFHGLAFSADGATLAVARPGRVISLRELHPDRAIEKPLGRVERWEVATGRALPSFGGHDEWVIGIAYSADGSTLVTADRKGNILIRDPDLGQIRHHLAYEGEERCSDRLSSLAVSADGSKLVSCGNRFLLMLWDAISGEPLRELTFPDQDPDDSPEWLRVAISPDGRTVAGLAHNPGMIELWDSATGQHLSSIEPNPVRPPARGPDDDRSHHSFSALAIAPDGQTLATAGDHDLIRLWDIRSGRELARLGSVPGDAVGVAFGPEGRSLAAVGSRGTVQVWDLPEGAARVRTTGHQSAVSMLAFAPDGRTLVSVGDDAVCVSHVAGGEVLRREAMRLSRFRESALSLDGRWLAYQPCGFERWVTIVEVASGATVHRFDRFSQEYGSLYFQFAADGETLIVAEKDVDGLVFFVYDLATGDQVRRVVSTGWDHKGDELSRYGDLTLSPDGLSLAMRASLRGNDDTLAVYDLSTGRFQHRFTLPVAKGEFPPSFSTVVFSPDGTLLATIDDGEAIRFWDVGQGRELPRIAGDFISSRDPLAFAPNGKVIASGSGRRGSGGTIRLWDVASGRELVRFDGHQGGVVSLAFSPDGRRLASGSDDTTVLVWDVADWR